MVLAISRIEGSHKSDAGVVQFTNVPLMQAIFVADVIYLKEICFILFIDLSSIVCLVA